MTDSSTQSDGGLIGLAIRRPVAVAVGVILVALFGGLSILGIPIQLAPDIAVPVLNVSTVWPGAAPAEIESEVLEPQEDALKTLPDLIRMTSTARFAQGNIELEMAVGTSLEEALVRASNLLSQVASYPDNVDQPVLTTSGSTGPPIIVAIIQSQTERSAGQFRTWAEEQVLPRFQRVDGIADVMLRGGQDTEIQIDFDAREMAARGLNLSAVAAVLRSQLRDLSAGDITIGKRRFLVRTPVSPDTPAQFAEVVIGTSSEGAPIRIGDVATVEQGLRKPSARVFSNGKESLAMLFFREAGTNVLEVTENVHAVRDRTQQDLMEPRGLTLEIVSDQTSYIYGALNLVQQNLLIGAVLAVIVLLIFLRSIGASAVVSIAIPVCVVGTALGMSLLGRTVNVVSLAGMAFAVGLVVDNALVVIENIDTWRGRGEPAARAALFGTREVWGAILASTLTTAAVFIPIIGWQDEVGELLRDIAIAISIAVIVSLVVSVLVVPSFAARLTRKEDGRRRVFDGLASRGEMFRRGVGRLIRPIAASVPRSLAVVTIAVVGAIALAWAFLPPMEYLPTGNRNLVFGILVPPPGYAVEEMEAIGRRIQGQMLEHTGVEKDGVPALGRSFYVGAPERAFMGATAEDPERVGEVAAFMRRVNGEIPDVFGIAIQASLFGRSLGGGRSIEIDVSGRDLDEIVPLAGRILGRVKETLPTAQVRPVPSLDIGAPELRVEPRREQLALVGMNASDLGLTIDALIDGAIIGEYAREGAPKLDVVLRQQGGGLTDAASLAAAPVATPGGRTMPLGVLADVRERLGPTVIQRIERRRAVTLQVTPDDDIALEDAMAVIRNDIVAPLRAEGALHDEMDIELSGAAGKLELAQARFGEVLLLAVLISFLLMAALFEDFVAPLAVLVTVPLAAAGGVLNLLAVDTILGRQPLDMMTALGFVILIGIVVNNAILVVDGAVARLREGMELSEAVAAAVERRVRPIFMSTLTSLAGLTPLVVFPGSGSELYRGVGAIVLGGLALSTVLTLVVVPALFSLLWRASRRA